MKISIITDHFNVPIFINSYNSTIHDAEILSNDLIHFHNKFPNMNNKILLGDTAYDSIKLRYQVKEILDSELLAPKNKRNIKDETILHEIEYSLIEKQILKSKNGIEYTFNKFKNIKEYNLYMINILNFLIFISV